MPCALSPATPTAGLTTAGLLARHSVLLRRLQSIEALSDIDTVIFDKTGILTDSAMNLQAVQTRGGITRDQALQWAASLAQHSLHPVSRALVIASTDLPVLTATNVKEIASSDLEGRFDIDHDGVERPSNQFRLGSDTYCGIKAGSDAKTDEKSGAISGANIGEANRANRRVYLADRQGWVATFEFDETLRPSALKTIDVLLARGLTLHILSGNTQAAALRVAEQLGFQNVQGNCSPENKLAFMTALQAKGCKVMMLGDGLNDGPTLAAAHVSVAIGAAVPLAQALSDLVIPGAQLFLPPVMLD